MARRNDRKPRDAKAIPCRIDLGYPGHPLALGQQDFRIFVTALMHLDRNLDTHRETGGFEIEALEHLLLPKAWKKSASESLTPNMPDWHGGASGEL